jgi:hypothetical protein
MVEDDSPAPVDPVPLSEGQAMFAEHTSLAGYKVVDVVNKQEWDFDTVLIESQEWSDAELKRQITRLCSEQALMDRFELSREDAKKMNIGVYDAALGMRWEDWAGQPALRVLTRTQLDKVLSIAKYLDTPRKDDLVKYILARYTAMRG